MMSMIHKEIHLCYCKKSFTTYGIWHVIYVGTQINIFASNVIHIHRYTAHLFNIVKTTTTIYYPHKEIISSFNHLPVTIFYIPLQGHTNVGTTRVSTTTTKTYNETIYRQQYRTRTNFAINIYNTRPSIRPPQRYKTNPQSTFQSTTAKI